jgi:hypothetical protein
MKALIRLLLIFCVILANAAQWTWIPEEEHPCTIEQIPLALVAKRFGSTGIPALYSQPIVIVQTGHRNAEIRNRVALDTIHQQFPPGFNVTLSSSNALSERRRTIPLEQYLNESLTLFETTPDMRSNESWYLFGETYTKGECNHPTNCYQVDCHLISSCFPFRLATTPQTLSFASLFDMYA